MKYFAIIAGIFGLDQYLKNYIEKQVDLEKQDNKILLIRRHHNKGMILNLGDKRQKAVAVLSLLMTVIITFLFILTLGKKGNALLHAGLSFLLGGAFSNTYDRLKRRYVVDYVSFNVPFQRLRNIVFNIADFCIMIGTVIVCCNMKAMVVNRCITPGVTPE